MNQQPLQQVGISIQSSNQASQIMQQNISQISTDQVIFTPVQKVYQILNTQSTLPIEEFKKLIEQIQVNKQFLLITLNHKGKYFLTMKKFIMMIVGLLTLQFYQLLYLFTTNEQINDDVNQTHSKFIFQNHTNLQRQKINNSFFQVQPTQQQMINLIRISYIIICWFSFLLIQNLTKHFSNKKLMLTFLTLISASYFIQGTQCNFITNYGSIISQDINENDYKKIYLERIIFGSCFISQAIFSTCLLYLTAEQAIFILKKSQRKMFNNDLVLIIVEFIIVTSTFHIIIKEHYIFNLILMWIPFTLVTIYAFFIIEDTPISILKKLKINQYNPFNQENGNKKMGSLKQKQENLINQLHNNLTTIFQVNYSNKNYFSKAEVNIIIDRYFYKQCDKKTENWKINCCLGIITILYFGHIFNLNLFVSSLKMTVETLALIISIFELIGYFFSNYFISTIYTQSLLKKMLITFALISILSSLQYFNYINGHFQTQIIFVSIVVIRLLFYIALKAFFIQFQNQKLNFNYVIMGLLLSNALFLQIQQIQLCFGILLILANHSIHRQ